MDVEHTLNIPLSKSARKDKKLWYFDKNRGRITLLKVGII